MFCVPTGTAHLIDYAYIPYIPIIPSSFPFPFMPTDSYAARLVAVLHCVLVSRFGFPYIGVLLYVHLASLFYIIRVGPDYI